MVCSPLKIFYFLPNILSYHNFRVKSNMGSPETIFVREYSDSEEVPIKVSKSLTSSSPSLTTILGLDLKRQLNLPWLSLQHLVLHKVRKPLLRILWHHQPQNDHVNVASATVLDTKRTCPMQFIVCTLSVSCNTPFNIFHFIRKISFTYWGKFGRLLLIQINSTGVYTMLSVDKDVYRK